MPVLFWIVPAAGVLTVLFVLWLARNVLKRDSGTPKMREIGDMIFQGAWAFMKRQYGTIAIFAVVVAIIIGVLVGVLGGNEAGYTGFAIGWRTCGRLPGRRSLFRRRWFCRHVHCCKI